VLVVAALAVTGMAVAFSATPASAQSAPGVIAKASISNSWQVRSQAATATQAITTCKSGSTSYNRFSNCKHSPNVIIHLVNGKPDGGVAFVIDQTDLLAVKSTTITEQVEIHDILSLNLPEPIELGVTATCGTGCRGDSHPPVALRTGATYTFDLHFVSSVARNAVRASTPTYTWTASIGQTKTIRGRQWRCDDTLREGAGCVYPTYVPTISMAGLKFVAASISNIQAHGGPRLLHRNSLLTRTNRRAVCRHMRLPHNWTPPPGWPLPIHKRANRPSCDEYPFAGTWEGGTRLPASQRGTAWVPQGENDSQGGQLNAFYLANRVLNATSVKTKGDAFYVAA
jgi:hypothetical protein